LSFFTSVTLLEAVIILVAKVIEVSVSTLRIILIGKGYRKPGTALAMVEILLWVFIASSVITGIQEAPIKGIIYSIGFATGVYLGSIIEDKIGVGRILIQSIVMKEEAKNVLNALRDAGHAVTSVDAYGKYKERVVILIFANRKNKKNIIHLINETDDDALIVTNDVSMVSGGFISPWRRLIK
jgi:uncharacterized protein YebE (UPF0316 family)